MEWMILGIFLLVAIAMGALSFLVARKRWQAWQRLADELGLQYVMDSIVGQLHGVPVEISTSSRGVKQGKHRRSLTTLSARFDPSSMPAGLVVTKAGISARIGELFTGPDVSLGMPTLDERLEVRGDGEAIASWAKSGSVGEGLEAVLALGEVFVITAESLQIDIRGALDDTRRLGALLERMAKIVPMLGTPGEDRGLRTPEERLREMMGD